MKLLENLIREKGIIEHGEVLKVDSFLNHQMDVKLFQEMGREWARLYAGTGINKILTIEASGIGIACVAALEFDVPVIFAKKTKTKNIAGEVFSSQVVSFTHNNVNDIIVSKKFLGPGDRVLIIDDFLANGAAMLGLIDIVKQSGAELVGCGIAIEKAFQPGGQRLRDMGIRVESLAKVAKLEDNYIEFCD